VLGLYCSLKKCQHFASATPRLRAVAVVLPGSGRFADHRVRPVTQLVGQPLSLTITAHVAPREAQVYRRSGHTTTDRAASCQYEIDAMHSLITKHKHMRATESRRSIKPSATLEPGVKERLRIRAAQNGHSIGGRGARVIISKQRRRVLIVSARKSTWPKLAATLSQPSVLDLIQPPTARDPPRVD